MPAKTMVGAPITVGLAEDSLEELDCTKYVIFGGAGCLNKEIAHGKVMVPTAAYRDEGTSYHYMPASDYVDIPNHTAVAECMKANGIPYVLGKTRTTDSFYRETLNNFEKRKADGCISVEMEGAPKKVYPDLAPKERTVDIADFRRIIGLDITAEEAAKGNDTDVQLERACDMLRGMLALQGR